MTIVPIIPAPEAPHEAHCQPRFPVCHLSQDTPLIGTSQLSPTAGHIPNQDDTTSPEDDYQRNVKKGPES